MTTGLFDEVPAAPSSGGATPLASRMRPSGLDELVGQDHLLGRGKLLRRAMEQDRFPSFILYGPPGSGKTTVASIIASTTRAHFEQLNAVTSGVADIRRELGRASDRLRLHGKRTVLFIDEIHRFNTAQQDALLGAVENGTVTLIGATAQNPYFEVNPPLLSRSRVFRLEPLSPEDVKTILKRALSDQERGLGSSGLTADDEALAYIAGMSNGDGRSALNALEAAARAAMFVAFSGAGASLTGTGDDDFAEDGERAGLCSTGEGTGAPERGRITLALAREACAGRTLAYDKDGDSHYDTISAFVKSLRGSDPDAAVYWLARMLYAGEDPVFIARRLVVHASEDVGNADPMALVVAVAAAQAVQLVGLPEARLSLAQATLYIAVAPKSNSIYHASEEARRDVEETWADPVPPHLRDASYRGAGALGHGKGYLYPHDFPGHYVIQQYLPDNLVGHRYYQPSANGHEREIGGNLALRDHCEGTAGGSHGDMDRSEMHRERHRETDRETDRC